MSTAQQAAPLGPIVSTSFRRDETSSYPPERLPEMLLAFGEQPVPSSRNHSLVGMDSTKLSARARQPGHDRTFRRSEVDFVAALHLILSEDDYEIVDHPRELSKIIAGRYGIVPEASIRNRRSGNVLYFEVKKQGPTGNADERAAKHHTVQFVKTLQAVTRLDYHPFVTIMCENLAVDERYVVKHPTYFEPDHYFCWVNYDVDLLADFLARVTQVWLEPRPQQ